MEQTIKTLNWTNLVTKLKSILLYLLNKSSGETTVGNGVIAITHADLLTLVNNSELIAGQQYRITDYVAAVDESVYDGDVVSFFARSNNHAFDIIVTADSINQLNENVRAIRHEGDTYFPSHTKFEAWQIKYTIFNDSERFDWAVSSGKGVIYQLIDEWGNDLPYDFKSIQFQRNGVWVYTFGGVADASLEVLNCFENKMLSAYSNINGYGLNNNIFGNGCNLNTFSGSCSSNTLGNGCISNTFGGNCGSNTLGNYYVSNTFGDYCVSNILGDYCVLNTLGNYCNLNTLGDYCYSNTFGNEFKLNTLGDYCQSNTFEDYCRSNTFGNYCESNTFGNEYRYFNIGSNIYGKDFTTLISLFTTPQNDNEIKVTTSVNGAVMSQAINATTTESIDI